MHYTKLLKQIAEYKADKNRISFLKGDLQKIFNQCSLKFQELKQMECLKKSFMKKFNGERKIQEIEIMDNQVYQIEKQQKIKCKRNAKLIQINTFQFKSLKQGKRVQRIDGKEEENMQIIKKEEMLIKIEKELENHKQKKKQCLSLSFPVCQHEIKEQPKISVDFAGNCKKKFDDFEKWKCPIRKCGKLMKTKIKYELHLDKCHNELQWSEKENQTRQF